MNSKQDILNAFREMRILNGYASIWKHHPMGVARDIDEWLLNALTEFEREVRERDIIVLNAMSLECMEEDKFDIPTLDEARKRIEKLEKEKHPSK